MHQNVAPPIAPALRLTLLAAAIVSLGLVAGCGRKGDPYLPKQTAPAATETPESDTSPETPPETTPDVSG